MGRQGAAVASRPEILVSLSTAELSWRVLGFVNGLRLLASLALATLFVSVMPETIGQLDPALFAGSATAYFLYAVISISSIRRRTPDIVLQTWTGAFADVLVLSLLTYASGGVNPGIAALVTLSVGATSFILQRKLALSIAAAAALTMLIQPAIALLADEDAVGDLSSAAVTGSLIIIIALGVSQLSRALRQSEELGRERDTTANEITDLHRAIAQHLREGILVVDANNNIPLISESAAMVLQGAGVQPGMTLDDVSPRLANLLDTWRRYFCDAQRGSPTMMAFDGERRLQLKFVSLDNSTQGPALIFVEDKSRAAAPVWLPESMAPASVQVNKVPIPRELPRPVESLPREAARAESSSREPLFEEESFAASAPSRVSAMASGAPQGNVARLIAARESRRPSPPRSNSLKENLARQNSFRAALQEVSPWENPKPAPPPQQQAPPPPAPARRQATRPATSMLTNNDPRLRIILGNALQIGRRDSVRMERVDLAAWCKEFLTEFWQTEDIDAGTLKLTAPRESILVRADSAHLQRLLWTLCTDLLKYGRANNASDPVEIRVGLSAKTQRRYLDVIDRGTAIGPIDSKRVFEPFLSAGKGGTGIALFVSRELSPGVRSGANSDPRPGGGVVFRLVFDEAPNLSPPLED